MDPSDGTVHELAAALADCGYSLGDFTEVRASEQDQDEDAVP